VGPAIWGNYTACLSAGKSGREVTTHSRFGFRSTCCNQVITFTTRTGYVFATQPLLVRLANSGWLATRT
jgi:hypothetical protein